MKKKQKISPAGKTAEIIGCSLADEINNLNKRITVDRWILAQQCYELAKEIPWRITSYKSFKAFTERHITMGYGAMNKHVAAYALAKKLRYTPTNLAHMSETMSFTTMVSIFTAMPERIPVHSFIKLYAGSKMQVNAVKGSTPKKSLGVIFSLILDKESANKLNTILLQHGMIIRKNNQRNHVSTAMINYLRTL